MTTKDYFNLADLHRKYHDKYHVMFILSPKGIGKTHSAVNLCFKNWRDHHKSFGYVFRYQVEVDAFINELKNFLPATYTLKKSKVNTMIHQKDGQLVGVLVALSQAHYTKNIQSLNLIIFDEVISAVGRYLGNELKQFYLLTSNFIRSKKKWNIYLLGNFHGPDNPYFNYFKMFQWKMYDGILTDGDIGYCELREDAYKKVISAQGANFLTKYDERLHQKYIKGGFTSQDLNMIQQERVQIMSTYYAVIYDGLKIYVHKLINGHLYFSKNGYSEKIYTLSLTDSLNYNNFKLNGKEISVLWKNKILLKAVIFEDFEVKTKIFEYLTLTNLNYEFK